MNYMGFYLTLNKRFFVLLWQELIKIYFPT